MGVLKKYIKQKAAEDAAVTSGNRYQAMADAGALNSEYSPPAPEPGFSLFGHRVSLPRLPQPSQTPAQRPATWGVQPLGQPAQPAMPASSYPAISSPLATVKPPSRPMTADYLRRARAVLSKTVPYALLTGNNPAVQVQTMGHALAGEDVAPQEPGLFRKAYLGAQALAVTPSLGFVQMDEARTPGEAAVQVGGHTLGDILMAMATGGAGNAVTTATGAGLARVAPNAAGTVVGRVLPRAAGFATQGAILGAGRVGVEALTNPGQMTAGQAAGQIGSEALSWGLMGAASETAGSAVRGALARLLPKAIKSGRMTPAVQRAIVAAGGGLATGATTAAVDTAIRYLGNPKQFNTDQAAGDAAKQALFFAGLDALMSFLHSGPPAQARVAGERPALDPYEFLSGTRNPATEGLREWQPGSGLWLDPKTQLPVLREVTRVTEDGGKVYRLDEYQAATRGQQAQARYTKPRQAYLEADWLPRNEEPVRPQAVEPARPVQEPAAASPEPVRATTPAPAEPIAAATPKPVRLEGWNTPVIKGMEKKAALQSGTLPEGVFIALDQPFESDAHDAKKAQRVAVDVQSPFDPNGLLDPANAEAHGAIAAELGQAIQSSGVLQSAAATAQGDPFAITGAIRRFSTDYLRQRGFDSYVRAIDGDPNNRELIVFDKKAVKRGTKAPAPTRAEVPGPSPAVPAETAPGQTATPPTPAPDAATTTAAAITDENPVTFVGYVRGSAKKHAPDLVKEADRWNKQLGKEGGMPGSFQVKLATTRDGQKLYVISDSGSVSNKPPANWRKLPLREGYYEDVYVPEEVGADGRPAPATKFSDARTGKPASLKAYHGSGRANKEAAYRVPGVGPVLGEGKYYALNKETAGRFGPDIEESTVELKNPLVVDDDSQWYAITQAARVKYPNFFNPMNPEQMKRDVDATRAYIEGQGYDGVIVRLADFSRYGDKTKTLDNMFGDDQVIVFGKKETAPASASPAAPSETPPAPEETAAMPAPFGEVARGSEVTAETERGTKITAHYAVAEASDLVASHDTGLSRNPDYPAELQPRDRGRIASEDQVSRIVSRLNPARLGDSPVVSDGAPVVGPDGVIESGNGRVIALKRIYEQGHENAGKYRQWLSDNAEKFGLDKKAIEGAQAPVLVRVRDTELDRVKFAQEANEQTVASMSATEKAKNDAQKLTGPLMAQFVPSETGEIDTPANRDFIRGFLGSVVGEAERGEYVQGDGSINQAGVLRIRNALFAKAYGDVGTLEKLAESTDSNVRTITNAMVIAASRLAVVKEGMATSRLHDVDITGDLTESVKKLSALRMMGKSVGEYLNDSQTSLLTSDLGPFAKDMLELLDNNSRSAKRLSSILLAYADAVEAAGDPRYGGDLLGRMAPTKAEVLTAALRKVEFGSEGQATLLEGEAAGGPANRAGAPQVSGGTLIIGASNGQDLRSALDDQGQIRVGLDSITIGADARVPADVAQAVKDAARGWEVVRNRDGGVTLRRPQGGFNTTAVREVEAFYERVGVREGEDPEKARQLATQAVSDIDHTLRAGLRTVAEGVAGFGGVQSGVRTLGVGIRAELTHRGRVEFRGKKVTTARQLAVLAQIVRNPQFEVFRIFYIKNGVIVADEAISSRLPANSNAFLGKPEDAIDQMKDRMKRLGADGYWLLHNHPSGRPLPSNDDVELTRGFAKELPGFQGHVVINSKKYGVLDSQHYFMPIMEDLPKKIAAKPDLLLSPSLDHPLLGAAIGSPLDVVTIGQQLKAPENYVTLLFRAADSKVRAIQQVPVGVFNYEMAAADYLRGRMREFGSAGVLAYYDGPKDLTSTARKLILNNALVDFVTPSGAGLRGALEGKIRKGAVAGLPENAIPANRVTEDQADYKMVGPDFFLGEPTRAEAGGVSAFAGARPAPSKPSAPAPLKPMQRKALIAWLGKEFKVTLAKGHFNQRALGIYKVKPEVIRTRAWGDLEVLAHEIGHHLDKQLGLRGMGHQDELLELAKPVSRPSYTVDQRLGEGVAEFLRLYLGDPAGARRSAPGFYNAFEQRLEVEPELAQVLSDAQDQFAAHFQATPDEEIDAATSWNSKKAPIGQRIRSLPEAVERAKNWMVDEFFDSNDAVRRIQEKIAGKGELPVEMDAYLRLNILPKLVPGKVEAKLRQWHEALAPLGKKAEDYFRYADARAVLWRSKQFGYDNSKLAFSREAAEAKIHQVEEGPDAKLYKEAFEKEQRLFHEALLELRDAGVLNDEAIARIEGAHKDYVPLFRDIEAKSRGAAGTGRTTVNLPAGVLRQRGGAEPHLDPVERRIRYFARVTGIAERNRVGVALAKFAEAFEGAGKLMDRIAPPIEMVKVKNEDIMGALEDMGVDVDGLDPLDTISFFRPTWAKGKNDTIITIYRGGKPHYYDLHDPAVFRAMAAVDPITTNILDKIMETGTGIFRLGATITPSFSVANLVRDTWESFALSKHQIVPGQALFQTLRLAASKDPFIRRAVESGLKQGGWLRPERQSVQMLQEIASGKRVDLSLRGLWHLYQQVREQPEFWTRLGEASLEYRTRLKKGASDEEAFLRALYEGGRITLNFTRAGYTTRVWNRRIAFFKIPFEAAYRTYEAAREHPGVFFLKLLPFIAWGAATALLNRDNKQYDEASDYERDRYLLLPIGKALVRIPKANGVFAVLQNTAERAMRQWMKDDPTAWREWGKDALNELTPRITNPAMELLVSWATGQSLESDFPVLTESDKNLPPEMQYDSKTSLLARGVGRGTGTSPKLVQHTIETVIPGYSQGLFGLENIIRRGTGAGGNRPAAARPEDLPVVGRFIARPGEGKQGRSISILYEERDQADKVYVAIKKKVAEATGQSWPENVSFSIVAAGSQDRIVPKGKLSAEQRKELTNQILQLQKSDPDQYRVLANRASYNKIAEKLSSLRSRRKEVEANTKMTPEAKRRAIEQINLSMTNLVRQAYGKDAMDANK